MALKIVIFGLGDLYKLGGVQVSYQHLIGHLVERGHEVAFYSHRDQIEGVAYAYVFPPSVPVRHYTLGETVEERQAIQRIAKKHDPDVILVVLSGQAALPLLRALAPLPYPVVLSERGGDLHNLQYNWFSKEQRALAHYLADATHFLMESYRPGLPAWMNSQITCIPSLIEPAEGSPADPARAGADGRFRLMYAGRLAFEKDVDILIRAFAPLAAAHPNWDMHVFGDGPDEESLRHLAAAELGEGMAGRIVFHAPLDQQALFDEYRRAHLFVLPSRNEGCPLALREAMAYGLPVIGFDTASGVNEIIEHGASGLLAGSDDKPVRLRDAIAELLGDPARRADMGRNGIAAMVRYAPEITLTAWERLLSETAAWKDRRVQLGRQRYHGAASAAKFNDYRRRLREVPKLRNLYLFDRDIALNRLKGVDATHYALCFGSVMFDPMWYGRTYFETKAAGLDPLAHYLAEGWRLGYAPSSLFDHDYYVAGHMDGEASEPPLVHFLREGRYDGAAIRPAMPAHVAGKAEKEAKADGNIPALLADPGFAERVRPEAATWIVWKRHVAALVPDHNVPAIAKRKPLPAAALATHGPRISVVIPVYNKEPYVRDAIESALAQVYHAIEVVAVDDGSDDRSPDILADLATRHANLVVLRQANQGLSAARNTGIDHATGDYVFFHDADDLMEPGAAAALAQAAIKTGSDIVGGVFNRRTDKGDKVVAHFQFVRPQIVFRDDPRAAYLHSTNFSSCNKMFRRAFLNDRDLRFVPGLYMQDIDFWLRAMFLANSYSQTDAIVSTYCLREGSWSGMRIAARFESLFRLVEGLERSYAANGLGEFRSMLNHALIQGAINFFVRWKLEEWTPGEDTTDLDRLRAMIARIDEAHLVSFYKSKNRGSITAVFLLLRAGDYAAARAVALDTTFRQHSEYLAKNQGCEAGDIMAFARSLIADGAAKAPRRGLSSVA